MENQTFKVGQVVYLNSDTDKKTPMTVRKFEDYEDGEYDIILNWINEEGNLETMFAQSPEMFFTDNPK